MSGFMKYESMKDMSMKDFKSFMPISRVILVAWKKNITKQKQKFLTRG